MSPGPARDDDNALLSVDITPLSQPTACHSYAATICRKRIHLEEEKRSMEMCYIENNILL